MKEIKPDQFRAKSLIESSNELIKYTDTLTIKNISSTTIFNNYYEAFRQLGDAYCYLIGIKPENHIDSLNCIKNMNINTKRPIKNIDNFRRTRNKSKYEGHTISIAEAKDIRDFKEKCFEKILNEIKKVL